jgi:hypothetical protein
MLMFLHPGVQPMKDSEVNNAGSDLQGAGPPQVFIDGLNGYSEMFVG